MENASELEAPRMSIQTKDLIRYNNHTTYYNKNHSKFIQKSQQHSTAKRLTSLYQPAANHLTSLYQPTAKRLGHPTVRQPETQPFLPAIQRTADSSSISRQRPLNLTFTPNSRAATLPCRLEKPAREGCAACRRTLQEGS